MLVALAAAACAVASAVSPCGTTTPDERDELLMMSDPLLWADAVVMGEVTNVVEAQVPAEVWGYRSSESADRRIDVSILTLQVQETLSGYQDMVQIEVYYGGRDHTFERGEAVILSVFMVPEMGMSYRLRHAVGAFVRSADGWARILPLTRRESGIVYSLSDIRARLSSVDTATLSAIADIVMIGKVTNIEHAMLTADDGTKVDANLHTIEAVRPIKGVTKSADFTVVTVTRGAAAPPWRTFVPFEVEVGETWYMFLKEFEYGYYPVKGARGLLELRKGELIYDRRVSLPIGIEELNAIVSQEGSR